MLLRPCTDGLLRCTGTAGLLCAGGSAARQSGQDFLWYLWCGKLSPLFGRSAMTTFEPLYVADRLPMWRSKTPIIPGIMRSRPVGASCPSLAWGPTAISSMVMCRCRRKTGKAPSKAAETFGGHRRRILPRLSRKDRYCRVYAGLLPHHVPAHPSALCQRRESDP